MGIWNEISRREDDHLSLLSSELQRLDFSITALSEVRRPDSGEMMARGYTFYWSVVVRVVAWDPKVLSLSPVFTAELTPGG